MIYEIGKIMQQKVIKKKGHVNAHAGGKWNLAVQCIVNKTHLKSVYS